MQQENVLSLVETDENVRKYAEKTLNETQEIRSAALSEIRKWAAENSHLHVRTEDKYLLPFLRAPKFNIEKAKIKLSNFYTMRRDRPEWFHNRNPLLAEIQDLARMGCFVPLKNCQDGALVVIIRATAHDPKRYSLNDVLKTGKMILDLAVLEEERSSIYGVIAIIDLSNLTLGHGRQMSVSTIKNMVYAWQNYHCRPQLLEFVNAPSYVNVVLDIFKRFMSEKLKSRVHVHHKLDGLEKIVNKDILPKEYGGTGETIEELGLYWNSKLRDNADWFAEDEKYKAE